MGPELSAAPAEREDTPPIARDEIGHNSRIGSSYGICADEIVHSDISHYYEVNLDDDTIHHYAPDDCFFDTNSANEIVSRTPENVFALKLGDVNALSNQSAQNISTKADGGRPMTVGTWGGCDWCASREDRYCTIEVGSYDRAVGDETVELCDECSQRLTDCLGEAADVISKIDGAE
jgi:hypothetical protein